MRPLSEPGVNELNARNKSAWNQLYASTSELIWGCDPIGFLAECLPVGSALPAGPILDAGAGEGRNLPPLLALNRPVCACDASAAALAKIPRTVAARISERVCDLEQTGYPDANFALILLSDTVETLPEPEPVLREMLRLLRRGGVLLANLPDHDDGVAGVNLQPAPGGGWLYQGKFFYRFFSIQEAESLFIGAGFELVAGHDCHWMEPPHPQFRDASHRHHSRVVLARRPA
ncbi:MAG TPA: methyltransferase domain-containing protein [Opitutaceae bacterium]|jgi:SAM-dependent methyltransferase